ncbi:MAG: MFS family permease [Polaribacter sp.]|jgi:MFS family permease
MENQASSKSLIINFGVYLGIATVLISLIAYALGMHLDPHWSVNVISGILFIGLIVFGIKKYKEINNGFLSWGQGVKIGVGIAIVAALIGTIYNYLFMTFIEPDFMNQAMEVANQKLLDQGQTQEQIEAINKMSSAFQSPFLLAAMGIIAGAVGGFVVAAIAAAIMKKSEEETY